MKLFREDVDECRISSSGTDPVRGRTPVPARLSGAPDSPLGASGITTATGNIRTVLMATGVIIRCSSNRRETSANYTGAETTMRLETIASLPLRQRNGKTAMNAPS